MVLKYQGALPIFLFQVPFMIVVEDISNRPHTEISNNAVNCCSLFSTRPVLGVVEGRGVLPQSDTAAVRAQGCSPVP